MDNSQSSDIFSDLANKSYDSDSINIGLDSYDCILNNIKASLCDTASITKSSFSIHFTSLLENCHLCISQSLNLVSVILSNTNIHLHKLSSYMEDAVSILQMLSSFIKTVVESLPMACCNMKTFPTTTGQIIMEVFTHCKNSETMYGTYLTSVEQQLKDLFRTCHELQLTYLMVLEKHFIFDLTEKEELDILVEALHINLHIGEVVQTLDVKTMAEQWKGFTTICEKYATYLIDKDIYQECIKLVCSMIINNIKQVMEAEPEEKLTIRSMKVTNFTIKILLKMCNLFKHSPSQPYTNIVDLLIHVYLHNPAYLEIAEERSEQFISIMTNNVLNPTDLLLKELIHDEEFVNVILNYDINKLKENDKLLGFVVLIAYIIKYSIEWRENNTLPKDKLISCVLNLLPHCFVWCNIGLKFKLDTQLKTMGLFEYLLIHCAGMALTMTYEQAVATERIFIEVLLGTDSCSALFSSNLWITITRLSNNKVLLLSQLTSLCLIYQKLENVKLFAHSPQKVHLTYTISALFELMSQEDRVKIYKKFDPLIQPTLWSVLKIKNLPIELQGSVQGDVVEKFQLEFQKLMSGLQNEDTFADLINITKLAATCSLHALETLEDSLVEMWLTVCPKYLTFLSESLDTGTVWYLEFVESLVSLTIAMKCEMYAKSSNIVKILHVISSIILLDNVELNLSLIDLLCKLASTAIHDENKGTAGKIVSESFKNLANCYNHIVLNRFFNTVKTCNNKYLEQIVSSIVNGDKSIEEVWQNFVANDKKCNYTIMKQQLKLVEDYNFYHKCIKTVQANEFVDKIHNSCKSNFDLADIDTLFENESDIEPASKKMKLDTSKIEDILNRLEHEVTSLCDIKENLFTFEHKQRINLLYEKLKEIVS